MSDIFEDLKKTISLPLGHIDRNKAQKEIAKIYELCSQQELTWRKKNKKILKGYCCLSKETAEMVLKKICENLAQKIPVIVWNSKELKYGTGGQYNGKEIHFPSDWVLITILIHELTHACGAYDHGKIFLEIEKLVMEATIDVIKNIKYLEAHPYLTK